MFELSTLFGLLVAMVAALEFGFRIGRRIAGATHDDASSQVGSIQAAVLGLLGLLLAFSFAAAGTRFLERQDLIVQEANAIGTAYLRAELLDEPMRSELRAALKEYTARRIEVSRTLRRGLDPSALVEFERMHARMWRAARDGVVARRELAVALLEPVNEVIDLHATRVGAARKHIPVPVSVLLVACSLLAIAMIGYGCGLDEQRQLPLTLSLTILVVSALWITIDLDHSREGLLQVSDAPLRELKFDAP
jgi:hypothetical protein